MSTYYVLGTIVYAWERQSKALLASKIIKSIQEVICHQWDIRVEKKHMLFGEVLAGEAYFIQLVIQSLPSPEMWDYIASLDTLQESGSHVVPSILAHSGCSNKIAQIQQLINNRSYFFYSFHIWKFEITLAVWWGEGTLSNWRLLCILTCWKGLSTSLGSLL